MFDKNGFALKVEKLNNGSFEVADAYRDITAYVCELNSTKWAIARTVNAILNKAGKGVKGHEKDVTEARKGILNNTTLTKDLLSKLEACIDICNEFHVSFDANPSDFSVQKVYTIARKPGMFTTILNKEGLEGALKQSARTLEAIANESVKPYYHKGELKVKAIGDKADKSEAKTNDKANDALVTVTDANGVKYNVPASILNKYKVTE